MTHGERFFEQYLLTFDNIYKMRMVTGNDGGCSTAIFCGYQDLDIEFL